MKNLIETNKSVIPALDISDREKVEDIVIAGSENYLIGAYKIGFVLSLTYGLKGIVDLIKEYDEDTPIIYDHQKCGTDIPATGKPFAKVCKESGVDSVIIFPQAGPDTQKAWIESCLEQDLHVITGGLMTHPNYVATIKDLSEEDFAEYSKLWNEQTPSTSFFTGGYIRPDAPEEMYELSFSLGIRDFVVPGNNPDFIENIRINYPGVTLYAPGFIKQGGEISESGKAAGDNFHAIVGSAIYKADNTRNAMHTLTNQL